LTSSPDDVALQLKFAFRPVGKRGLFVSRSPMPCHASFDRIASPAGERSVLSALESDMMTALFAERVRTEM
jgi:hypothetical protein